MWVLWVTGHLGGKAEKVLRRVGSEPYGNHIQERCHSDRPWYGDSGTGRRVQRGDLRNVRERIGAHAGQRNEHCGVDAQVPDK